jgi:hypothetical protein
MGEECRQEEKEILIIQLLQGISNVLVIGVVSQSWTVHIELCWLCCIQVAFATAFQPRLPFVLPHSYSDPDSYFFPVRSVRSDPYSALSLPVPHLHSVCFG